MQIQSSCSDSGSRRGLKFEGGVVCDSDDIIVPIWFDGEVYLLF